MKDLLTLVNFNSRKVETMEGKEALKRLGSERTAYIGSVAGGIL